MISRKIIPNCILKCKLLIYLFVVKRFFTKFPIFFPLLDSQSRIEKLQMLLSVPRFLLEKLFSLCSFSWSYLSSIEPYVKQILDTIDTLFLSFAENGAAVQNMMGMLGDLPTVLTILSQLSENMQWSSNFPSFLTQILSLLSSSTKKVVSSGPVPPSVRSRL